MTRKRYLYGCFLGNGKWGMTTNKKVALTAILEHGGQVRSMPLRGASDTYDAPTFLVLSDQIAWTDDDTNTCGYHFSPSY